MSLIVFIETFEIFTLQIPGSHFLIQYYYEMISRILDLDFIECMNTTLLSMVSRIIKIELPAFNDLFDTEWLQPRDTIISPL